MEETKRYIQSFLSQNKIDIASDKAALFAAFACDEKNVSAVKIIQEKQKKLPTLVMLQPIKLIN